MLYCLICKTKYADKEKYDEHIRRKKHRTNLMKLQKIYKNKTESIEYLEQPIVDEKKQT